MCGMKIVLLLYMNMFCAGGTDHPTDEVLLAYVGKYKMGFCRSSANSGECGRGYLFPSLCSRPLNTQ